MRVGVDILDEPGSGRGGMLFERVRRVGDTQDGPAPSPTIGGEMDSPLLLVLKKSSSASPTLASPPSCSAAGPYSILLLRDTGNKRR